MVLDEPTEGLDPNQIVHIRELIRSLAGRHTIILSSHILSEVQNTCDHIIIIHQGKIVQQGSYAELIEQLHAGKVIRVRVAKDAARLASTLVAFGGILSPRVTDEAHQEIEFGLAKNTNESVLDEVARKIIDGGFGLREMAAKTQSLEEVFFKITH